MIILKDIAFLKRRIKVVYYSSKTFELLDVIRVIFFDGFFSRFL